MKNLKNISMRACFSSFRTARFLALAFLLFSSVALHADWKWENDLSSAEKVPVTDAKGPGDNDLYAATFEYENTGNPGESAIAVTGVTFSCSCVSLKDFKATSARPGEKGTLTIRLHIDEDARARMGHQGQDLELIAVTTTKGVSAKELAIRVQN